MKTLVVAVCVCLVAVLAVTAKETTTASPSTTSPSPSTTEATTPASDAKKPAKDESVSGKSASGDAAKKPSSTPGGSSSGNATTTERPIIKAQVRKLPADVLRDFPGLCFASTLCRVFQPGENWNLFPFCGLSTCVETPEGGLVEVVEDCGPLPIPDERCRILNEADRNSTFPECCPVFECEEGVELTYLDPEAPTAPPGASEGEATAKETSTPSSA
ncbi:uncharacterized protein LOC143040914 [Oratosquilla oratoria]|uniref:uncharacterized protein LOC143040914 n=1 Tax=Oratosquilla oratoria TaxID=337810 RepID=UPI003F7607D0